MNLIHSIVLGIVEGVTEFLPISSTAHLIITSKFLGLEQTEFQTFFEVFIQSGAILAVIFLYLKYLLTHKDVLKNVVVSFIPTAVIGFFLYDFIKNVFFESTTLIILSLAVVGVFFLFIEKEVKSKRLKLERKINGLTTVEAVVVGCAQALAVVPGVSRAGIVIVAMMLFRFKRSEAAVYSFLLAMPTIIAASLLDLYQSKDLLFSSRSNTGLLITGFAVSFITAYVSVKWLLSYLQKNTLTVFAYYRLILAIILVLIFGL